MLHVQNVICAFFLSAASNPFHKDRQREEAQGAGNTSSLEAVEPGAPGSLSSTSAQPESSSFLQGGPWGAGQRLLSLEECAKRKAIVPENEKAKTPLAAQT